jgi:hypothetical protein
MVLEVKIFSDKDPIAIYAAIVATFAIILDMVKWWQDRCPKLKIDVIPNMSLSSPITVFEKDVIYTVLNLANIGTKSTTITAVYVTCYKNKIHSSS